MIQIIKKKKIYKFLTHAMKQPKKQTNNENVRCRWILMEHIKINIIFSFLICFSMMSWQVVKVFRGDA